MNSVFAVATFLVVVVKTDTQFLMSGFHGIHVYNATSKEGILHALTLVKKTRTPAASFLHVTHESAESVRFIAACGRAAIAVDMTFSPKIGFTKKKQWKVMHDAAVHVYVEGKVIVLTHYIKKTAYVTMYHTESYARLAYIAVPGRAHQTLVVGGIVFVTTRDRGIHVFNGTESIQTINFAKVRNMVYCGENKVLYVLSKEYCYIQAYGVNTTAPILTEMGNIFTACPYLSHSYSYGGAIKLHKGALYISVRYGGRGKGKDQIQYFSADQLMKLRNGTRPEPKIINLPKQGAPHHVRDFSVYSENKKTIIAAAAKKSKKIFFYTKDESTEEDFKLELAVRGMPDVTFITEIFH